ncbi:MAG: sugar-binding protein, partial [Planctomycetota bacterium]|nr:sugar-binding protein [Planctomycetota bacterium]
MLAKKCLFVGIFTLLSLSLAIADPPADHPTTGDPLVIDCFRGTPDAIDGDLSDWNLAAMTPAILDTEAQLHSGQATWDGADDSSGEFYLLWDDDNIYIAVVMKDEKLSMNKSGGSIWNADAIEVFFSTLNAVADCSEHYQYGFNANNQRWNWCNMDGPGQSEPDYLQIASSLTPDGYICEVSIEYGQMLSLDFSVGNTIGFHPVFDDTDNGDRELQMTWTGREAHDQSLGFGHLFLSDVAISGGNPLARRPDPADGDLIEVTWATLTWKPGQYAVSHDLYIGDNFDDVNSGAADTFVGNQASDMLIVGFPGFPIPDGLQPGSTYYWRVDEVNDANAASPWKGNVWSFSVVPQTAYAPDPADGAEFVALDATLNWTAGYGAKLHTVYIGNSFDEVNDAVGGVPQGVTTFTPAGPLEAEKIYYWRVDEFDAFDTHKGDVWSFTTPGAVGNPQPANSEADVQMIATLSWTPADNAASHEVYFGTDKDAVNNATAVSPEYAGAKALGSESYDPGKLAWDAGYYWRVDEVYATETIKGLVWSFETADFILVEDFESYNDIDPPDAASNRIFDKWIDGFGTTTNGALVGNDLPPYAEQGIVRGGVQSMIYRYDNANKTSEATLTLVYPKDWTDEGVTRLSLWFRGASANAADRMFVALNGNAVVYHDDPAATQ